MLRQTGSDPATVEPIAVDRVYPGVEYAIPQSAVAPGFSSKLRLTAENTARLLSVPVDTVVVAPTDVTLPPVATASAEDEPTLPVEWEELRAAGHLRTAVLAGGGFSDNDEDRL